MTLEDLKKIPFKMIAHLNMVDEHCSTYMSTDPEMCIEICVHQPYRRGMPHGKCHTHYRYNGRNFMSAYVGKHDLYLPKERDSDRDIKDMTIKELKRLLKVFKLKNAMSNNTYRKQLENE